MTKVAVLGSGVVGKTLVEGFSKHGFEATQCSRESFADKAKWGDIVVLALKGTVAVDVVKSLGAALDGKLVIDTTNPIADAPPEKGVLRYITGPNESLMERMQAAAPKAKFVKCFNSVGAPMMVNPKLSATPTMFIAGNDADAKKTTTDILTKFGWETLDCGPVEAARPIEALCQLWCIPGFVKNDWTHAFKMLWLNPPA
ncbi:MAG: NAD(P)-binding domain-containing protein [Kofleriaceae bacterium]